MSSFRARPSNPGDEDADLDGVGFDLEHRVHGEQPERHTGEKRRRGDAGTDARAGLGPRSHQAVTGRGRPLGRPAQRADQPGA